VADLLSEANDSSAHAQLAALRALILRVWGYAELRPLQAEAMLAALAGRDRWWCSDRQRDLC
jgi:hypothetical protein